MGFFRSYIEILLISLTIYSLLIDNLFNSIYNVYNLNRKPNDTYSLNRTSDNVNVIVFPSPYNQEIRKIDVGQGNDTWILDINNNIYHWCTIQESFILKEFGVEDFSVASDGSIAYINRHGNIYIRERAYIWRKISDGHDHKNISICDHNTIFTTDVRRHLIKGVYDNKDGKFKWEYVDPYNYYDQIFCALRDKSLWFTDRYAHLLIDSERSITRSEVSFRLIKALSEKHAIGIDFNHTLWEYTKGTWKLIRNNVRSASINYDGDIFYVDNDDNSIYKIKRHG